MVPAQSSASSLSASASASAMAAATGATKMTTLPTPQSATYPSSLYSPLPSATMSATPSYLKTEHGALKTPLTPPSAYLDFLKQTSPGQKVSLATPMSSGGFRSPANRPAPVNTASRYPYPQAPATARPALTSNASSGSIASSNDSHDSVSSTFSAPEPNTANCGKPISRPHANASAPRSSSTGQIPSRLVNVRRPSLLIPESPSSSSFNLASAAPRASSPQTLRTPWSTVSAPDHSTWSPLDWESKTDGIKRPVKVRHVVTRTVTYSRASGGRPVKVMRKGGTAMPSGIQPPQIKEEEPTSAMASAKDTAEGSTAVKREADGEVKPPRMKLGLNTDVERAPMIPTPLMSAAPRGKRRKLE